ncbi:MAG: hypothetical protein AMXMBFR59_08050 [Rhodanobacteraceae bacterium]
MIGRIIFLFGGALACSSLVHALTADPGDAGQAYQFQTKRAVFTLVNDEETEASGIRITPARPSDRVISAPTRLAPGERREIEVELNAADDFGTRSHMFLVESAGAKGSLVARVRLYGLSVLNDPGRVVEFGRVPVGDTPTIEYALSSDDPEVRIVEILKTPQFATASIINDGRGLIVRHVKDPALWGLDYGTIQVKLNSALQPELAIPVRTEVRGSVMPSSLLFELGIVRIGAKNDFILQYRHVDGKSFKLEDAKLEGIAAAVSVGDCVGSEKGCQQVRFVIDDEKQVKGQLKGMLSARVSGVDRTIRTVVGGMLVGKDAKIESLNDLLAAQRSQTPSLNQALGSMKAAQQPIAAPIPEGTGPLLQWTVLNEDKIYGYAIYRAEAEDGPFSVQGPIVRRSVVSKAGIPTNYAVRDNEATVGKYYWYRIATLYSDGKREFLTAAQRVKAGGAADGSP